MSEQQRKRAAVEPAAALFDRDAPAPADAARPSSLIGGTALVLLRAVGTVLWVIGLLAEWPGVRVEFDLTDQESAVLLGILLGLQCLWIVTLLLFAWLVWLGSNVARILVMVGAITSITTAAISYFAMGEEITVRTTLVTLALDILVLLALSSREARAWTRGRKQRRMRRKSA
ncbi:MAG: hypothetical protein ACK5LO_11555 [Leucobacter sp.]